MAKLYHGLGKLDRLTKECLDGHALGGAPLPDTLGRLLPENPITGNLGSKAVIHAFDRLVDSMRTEATEDGPADAGQTFFGQFVDHDITLDAASSIGSRLAPRTIRNVRTPALDLDCVYGDGPEASPHLYSEEHEGFLLFGREDNHRDLARNCRGTALIGDPRNDENVLVSQVHGAFVTLHNILMSTVREDGDAAKDVRDCAAMGMRQAVLEAVPAKLRGFEDVRRFVRLHYQWLVLNELLPAFVDPHALKKFLFTDPFGGTAAIMPVEFTVAAYRFGHATVQPRYVFKEGGREIGLFEFEGFGRRTADSDIDFAKFFSTGDAPSQRAQPVGITMADPLFALPFVEGGVEIDGVAVTPAQAAKLALRNLLRDRFTLNVASGQQAARFLGVPELAAPPILRDAHITKTPLWFYCLQEAAELGNGNLTGVGAAITASVFGRLLKLDPESVAHVHGFAPWSGFGGEKCTFGSVMAFVVKHRDDVAHAADLRCG